jgi:hypothetical protein
MLTFLFIRVPTWWRERKWRQVARMTYAWQRDRMIRELKGER